MVENIGDNAGYFAGLAKRQLHRLSERTAFLEPIASIADMSWRILLLIYAAGESRAGIPESWEEELKMPGHTLKRYLEMLAAHGFVDISGTDKNPMAIISLAPDKKRAMDELLSHDLQSGELFPGSSDFG